MGGHSIEMGGHLLESGGHSLDEVVGREPVQVQWPDRNRLSALLDREARLIVRAEGISTPGFERVLIDRARECVDSARDLEWPAEGSEIGVLGAEIEGSVTLRDGSGAERELRFRADRIDRAAGVLRLIDYKTGKAISDGVRPDTRRRNFLKGVFRGAALQASAYSMGAIQIASDCSAQGRYLYLGAVVPEHARVAEVDSEDSDFSDAFERVAEAAFGVWDRGSFLPRLVDLSKRKEPNACSSCSVKEACLRGDSGSRHRLERWMESLQAADDGESTEAERAAVQLWNLGVEQA